MRASYNWLQDNFEDRLPAPEVIRESLIMHAFEVESVEEVDALGEKDYLFDIKILPNRAHDCNSHLGIAREIAILFDLPLKHTRRDIFAVSHNLPSLNVTLDDLKLCPRYMGRLIKNIKVGESPLWLKRRLSAIGQRSINNIVDAANYVMFQTGQPLHAFDADKVVSLRNSTSMSIRVRSAKAGEQMVTLDGKDLVLDPSMLIIADLGGPLALAGIKGGIKAATTEETTSIILESANFAAAPIRRTSQKTSIRTDASFRFEHELAPELAELGMKELTRIILELASTDRTLVGGVVDMFPESRGIQQISFNQNDIERFLGISMDKQMIEELLSRFKRHAGFDWEKVGEDYVVMVPNERLDLVCIYGPYSGGLKEDIIEELARVNGYEKIPFVPLTVTAPGLVNKERYYSDSIRDILVGEGFSEVYNYSLVGAGVAGQAIELANPLTEDKKYLRTNLRDGLSQKLAYNIKNKDLLGIDQVKIFEIGHVFPSNNMDGEEVHCSIAVESLGKKDSAKASLERVLSLLSPLKPNVELGEDGVIEFDINRSIVSLPSLDKYQDNLYISPDVVYKPISPFPFVTRDIAVFVPVDFGSEGVLDLIKGSGTNLLIKIRPFDQFIKKFPDGSQKISYAFRLVFQSNDRTLTGEEINIIIQRITSLLNSKVGWKVR